MGAHCVGLRARLAQSAERKALNLVVVGSSPTVGVFAGRVSNMVVVGGWSKMDTLVIEPKAFRMQSGRGTTTPCARHRFPHRRFACCMFGSPPGGATQATPRGFEPLRAEPNGFRVHLLHCSGAMSWQQSHGMHAKRCKTHIARNSATVILCGCQIGPTRA